MPKFTFEDYLMEQHAEQYVGMKDCMIDDFNDWVQDLGVDEIIEYGDKFQKQVNSKLLEAIKYYLAVLDEVNGKEWREKPDHVTSKMLQAIAKTEGGR